MTAVETLVQPDIQYHPDWDKYQARTARRKATETLPQTVPNGFPTELVSNLVWEGKDVASRDDWVVRLSETELDEIHGALQSFKARNLPWGAIDQSTFPLPTLHDRLRQQSRELHLGRGFFVLRGLRIDHYSREDNIIIYAGVSAHVGNIRGRQEDQRFSSGTSLVLSHIKDITRTTRAGTIGAPSNTADKQVFHTDAGDIVSLLCLHPAAAGGESKIASSWLVYNILARERPDLIHTLSQDWRWLMRNKLLSTLADAEKGGVEATFVRKYALRSSNGGAVADDYAIHGGGFPVRVRGVDGVVGVIVVSGLKQEDDHQVIVDVVREFISQGHGGEVPSA
ncbi:Clavaminate synthase-like protein [Aspergillus fijiensis CBS 313.89]|uniref:Clavaminate synthase-like protein n=1 Tax=Aspergillus fijiensis CBS 313.89 TaxID=1448319 RepID=A0A8G1RZW2_9EURO|nr:Clavaminate synthase-like protein [Aspergillus fijiensis CBS 313.89]RAK82239.1 Clavaminate synthase-like protein [Aspergillus fijiensis CBS 313.89]